MQGLLEAAKAKGVNMTGMKLNITELHENMIAYTMSDGVGHYTLIREVNNETVKLADPTMGNIEMSLEEFQEIYTVITPQVCFHSFIWRVICTVFPVLSRHILIPDSDYYITQTI